MATHVGHIEARIDDRVVGVFEVTTDIIPTDEVRTCDHCGSNLELHELKLGEVFQTRAWLCPNDDCSQPDERVTAVP